MYRCPICSTARLCASLATFALLRAQEPAPSPQNPAAHQHPHAAEHPAPAPASSGSLRLIDVSLVIDASVGGSTARDDVLLDLQGGGHDPRQRGFTLQQVELALAGAVDPYCRGDVRIVAFLDPDGETVVELEEAYLTSLQLPQQLELRAGLFLTRFGRSNDQHPHAWDWQDQPIMNTRVFGGDGMRAPGAQLAWRVPAASHAELCFAVQDGSGETMRSFFASEEVYVEDPVGGRFFVPQEVRSLGDFVYTLRAETRVFAADASEMVVGASAACGGNATGSSADTLLYGADFGWSWRPSGGDHSWPFATVEGELLGRRFDCAAQVDDRVPASPVALPAEALDDCGGSLQAVYGFTEGWSCGLRVEYATGSGASYDAASQTFGRAADPLRADRWRVSPLLTWHPSESSRFRLQYNWDDTDALAGVEHSVWLGFEILLGAHPPHR